MKKRRDSFLIAVLQTMRPRQWSKNLFVGLGLLFTLDRPHPPADFARIAVAFVLFCILSGSVYFINDIRDAERDRRHPAKSRRPIASGRLSESAAWVVAFVLLVVGIGGSFALDPVFGEISLAYLLLLTAYSFVLKEIVILDVMTIAAGFVLRAVAGTAAIRVTISPWLLICTVLLALFLGLSKRRGELVGLREEASNHRSSLEHYTVPFLDQLINITSAATIIAYALYTFFSDTGSRHPYMMATLPFVIYGIFRYLLLVQKNAGNESPELILLSDKPLLIDIALWALTAGLIVSLG
jgi:4-hydroxybenzoate polyprenyltransferase